MTPHPPVITTKEKRWDVLAYARKASAWGAACSGAKKTGASSAELKSTFPKPSGAPAMSLLAFEVCNIGQGRVA